MNFRLVNHLLCVAGVCLNAAILLALAGVTACDRSEPTGRKSEASSAVAGGGSVPGNGPPAVATTGGRSIPVPEELSEAELEQIKAGCVLVAGSGSGYLQGVRLEGRSRGDSRTMLILCPPTGGKKTIRCARISGAGRAPTVSSARMVAELPSGLSVYSYNYSGAKSAPANLGKLFAAGPVHCLKLSGEGTLGAEERQSLQDKLRSLEEQFDQKRQEQQTRMMDRRQPRSDYLRQSSEFMNGEMEIQREMSKITDRLEMPLTSISIREVARANTVEELESQGPLFEDSILVSGDRSVRAIRHQGKWLDLNELSALRSEKPDRVKLEVSGSDNSVNLSCTLEEDIPLNQSGYSMVAATTFELESTGSGSVQERLSRVTPVAFQVGGQNRLLSKSFPWNGRPTTLWLKVFNDDKPETPVLDEMILLDNSNGFTARWGKPPSPLLDLPKPEPDSPSDLEKERTTVDAGGKIWDMVPAGDGSTLMIQTDRPPFWALLDLNSGRLETPPWTITADTLLAAQGNNVYLIDRKSKVVEIWDLASGKRKGLQILPVATDIIAAAAPLKDSKQPLLIVGDSNAWFVDPENFEILANGLDIPECFGGVTNDRRSYPRFDPTSTWARASGDGTLYSISGMRYGAVDPSLAMISVILDQSLVVRKNASEPKVISTSGRSMGEEFPDHGGGDLHVVAKGDSRPFPGGKGTISIIKGKSSSEYMMLNSPPLIPLPPDKPGASLIPDRGLYFDSSLGVMLLPDGDKLHLLRLNLPPGQPAPLEFVFTGEEVTISLPDGTGYKSVVDVGGNVRIGNGVISWKVPDDINGSRARLRLEWTGELGSTLTRDQDFEIVKRSRSPIIESADGRLSMRMQPRGVIPVSGAIRSFAGGGHVILSSNHSQIEAWSLSDCERLFVINNGPEMMIGDADQLYTLGRDGVLKSYELQTGNPVKEASLGYGEYNPKGLMWVITGMSSRLPLIAIEKDGFNSRLIQIDRSSLQASPIVFQKGAEVKSMFPRLQTNASGSVVLGLTYALFRNSKVSEIRQFENIHLDGDPDATGRYSIGQSSLMDLGISPPNAVPYREFAGAGDSVVCRLDRSGRYMFFCVHDEKADTTTASVREVRLPGKELFKLRIPAKFRIQIPDFISDTRTMICPVGSDSSDIGVYDFDIPKILEELPKQGQRSQP